MSRLVSCIALLLASTSPAYAKDFFTGTWKGDVKASQMSTKPSVTAIDKGIYTCSSCIPAVAIPADGAPHPVSGHSYYDAMTVTVVDPATVKYTTTMGGKPMSEATATVSADGASLTTAFTDMTGANGMPVTGNTVSTRVAAGPAGSHAVSGSWRQTNDSQISDSGLVFTLVQSGRTLTYSTPTGTTYTATMGGPAVAVKGDPGWTSVSLKRVSPATVIETDLLDGKVIGTYTMTVSLDRKKMTIAVNDIKYGKTSTLVAFKQ